MRSAQKSAAPIAKGISIEISRGMATRTALQHTNRASGGWGFDAVWQCQHDATTRHQRANSPESADRGSQIQIVSQRPPTPESRRALGSSSNPAAGTPPNLQAPGRTQTSLWTNH